MVNAVRRTRDLTAPRVAAQTTPYLAQRRGMMRQFSHDTGFFHEVYALVAGIPPGKVMTYGQIAAYLGGLRSARYVGFAMASAPRERNLPCHRVINRLGEMAGGEIFGGKEQQRAMLEKEGAVFTADGRVDLAACRFDPEA